MTRTSSAALALSTALVCAGMPAAATNGYFTNGTSPQSKAMAGASVAVETGVPGIAANPALGTAFGNAAEGCLSLFAPTRSATFGTTTFESDNDLFPIPCLGTTVRLGNGASVGINVYGNGGLNTEYPINFFGGSAPLGVNLEQLFVSVHYAIDVTDQLSLGIAPVVAFQRFEATGLEPFTGFSGAPGSVTNNGLDTAFGYGATLGLIFRPSAELTLGASYRTKIDMSEFDDYAGLYAGAGDFDIPATATLGIAYRPGGDGPLELTAEYQRIFYGDIPAIANSFLTATGPLGAPDGPGFGWKDMDVVRVAASYDVDDRWTVRGGVSYATEFADAGDVLLNTLAPATPQWHLGLGASYRVSDRWDLHASYVRVLEGELAGTTIPPFPAAPVEIRMDQHELTVGATYRW